MHNRECPKCGTIGEWNKQPRKNEVMPNGETISIIPIDGVICPKCGFRFEPHSHALLIKKLNKLRGLT